MDCVLVASIASVDRSAENELRIVGERLPDGLYVNNLHAMLPPLGRLVRRTTGSEQLAAWVVESVVADLCSEWDGRMLPTEEYDRVSADLTPALQNVIDCLLVRGTSSEDVNAALEHLVSSFIQLQRAAAAA